MTEVKAISPIQPQVVNTAAKSEDIGTKQIAKAPSYQDCTQLYSDAEIKGILERVGAPKPQFPAKYSVSLYESGALVINNQSMTNDTVEISKDGEVRHVGSWHNKVLAEKGSFADIVKDAEQRLAKVKNNQ